MAYKLEEIFLSAIKSDGRVYSKNILIYSSPNTEEKQTEVEQIKCTFFIFLEYLMNIWSKEAFATLLLFF